MKNKTFFAIATLSLVFTSTAFAQWHPEIDKVKGHNSNAQSIKSPRDMATGQIKSPRDVASGQATGRTKAPRQGSAAQDKLGNFEIQDIKSPRDTASGQATGITSPRDVASGQATGKRQHKPIAQQAGFMDFNNDGATTQIQPGQNSGGTLTNQRRRQPVKGYKNGGVEHEDTWGNKSATKRLGKYANQEVSYRRNSNASQVTHDADFEKWASLKRKKNNR